MPWLSLRHYCRKNENSEYYQALHLLKGLSFSIVFLFCLLILSCLCFPFLSNFLSTPFLSFYNLFPRLSYCAPGAVVLMLPSLLKPKLLCILFKNSVRKSKKTQRFAITKNRCLMLFKKIIAVYSTSIM
jgi:hypothetical protein